MAGKQVKIDVAALYSTTNLTKTSWSRHHLRSAYLLRQWESDWLGCSEVDPIPDTDLIPSVSWLIPDGEGVWYGGIGSLMLEHILNTSISSLATVLGTATSARYQKKRQSDVEFAHETYLGRDSGRYPLCTAIIGERIVLKWL